MLDLVGARRDHSARSMDDVMRAILERFSARGGSRERTSSTRWRTWRVQRAAAVRAHVRRPSAIDFDRYLRLIGCAPG